MPKFLIEDPEEKTLADNLKDASACCDDTTYVFGSPCCLSSMHLIQFTPNVVVPRRRMATCPCCKTMFGVELSQPVLQVS